MAADKEYEVKIGTTADTAGAKEAEKALDGVSIAAKSAEEAMTGSGNNPMAMPEWMLGPERIDEVADATEELEEVFEKLRVKIAEVAEETGNANEATSEMDGNVARITRAQRAQALSMLVKQVGQIASRFRDAANEVEAFDEAAADSLRKTADRIEGVTSAVSALAMGFAVGGPLGAGVTAIGLGIGKLISAYQESEVAAIKSAAEQRRALLEVEETTRKAAIEARARATALESEDIERAIERQNAAMERGLQIIRDQVTAARQRRREDEEILKAQDKLELALIDEDEARGGIGQVEAETRREAVSVAAAKRADDERYLRAQEDARKAKAEAAAALEELEATNARRIEAETQAKIKDREIEQMRRDVETITRNLADLKEATENYQTVRDNKFTSGATLSEAGKGMESARETLRGGPGGAARLRELTALLEEAQKERVLLAEKIREAEAADVDQESDFRSKNKDAKSAEDAVSATRSTIDARASAEANERQVRTRTRAFVREREAREREEKEREKAEQKRIAEEAKAAEQAGKKDIPDRVSTAMRGASDTPLTRSLAAANDAMRDGATADEFGALGAELKKFTDAAVSLNAERRQELRKLTDLVHDMGERMRRNQP